MYCDKTTVKLAYLENFETCMDWTQLSFISDFQIDKAMVAADMLLVARGQPPLSEFITYRISAKTSMAVPCLDLGDGHKLVAECLRVSGHCSLSI